MEAGDDMDPPGHEVVISIDDLRQRQRETSSEGRGPAERGERWSRGDGGAGRVRAGKTATCRQGSPCKNKTFTLTGEVSVSSTMQEEEEGLCHLRAVSCVL